VQRLEKRPHLLLEACKPATEADEALKEITKERKGMKRELSDTLVFDAAF